MVDFSTYQPPGTYIEEDLSSRVTVTGVRSTVVAIVGPSVGYRTHTEAITLEGTVPVQLSRLGGDVSSVVVRSADETTYSVADDYTVIEGPGEDADVGTARDNTLSVARVDLGTIADGQLVYVTYRYTDASFTAPARFNDFDDIEAAYGPALNIETGTIVSPLSFAAKVAFENGARELVLAATDTGDLRSQLQAAYTRLASRFDVNVVVPLPVGLSGTAEAPGDLHSIGTDLQTHVQNMSNDGLFRVGILGYETEATIDPAAAAAAFRSKRMVLAWPNRLLYYHGYLNKTIEVAGYYLAVAYAGRLAGLAVQEPLTKKAINSFSGLPADVLQGMSKAVKDGWSDQGVAVAEMTRLGRLEVRHGTTTQRSNMQSRELSLVRARDQMVSMFQETFDSSEMVGTWIDADTADRVKGVAAGVLESAKGSRVIVDYTDLKVRQLTGDPSIIEVKFAYSPAYPLNYIVVSFSIDTSSGETTLLDTAA